MSTSPHEIGWTPAAQRDLARLSEKVVTAIAEFVHGPLADNPGRAGRPLHLELAGRHAARRGDYRVIYRIDDVARAIRIESADHRSDVYRRR